MLSQKEKLIRKFFLFLPFVLVALFWFFSLIAFPTFDLDESLYRRAAEEMKATGSWWIPTWDQIPLFHKPPIFYWLIILMSAVVDGANGLVSTLASRLPSFLCSIGILTSLYFAPSYILNQNFQSTRKMVAPLLYLSAFFPILTGTSVLFDPLQTLVLMPALIFTARYFYAEKINLNETALICISIVAATAIKGLNGFLIPAVAFGTHALLQRKNFLANLVLGIKIFVPALILSVLYYLFLDYKMGRGFTTEFFLVHHFGRSQGAMESHGGSFLYHPLFVWISGGFLSFFLIQLLTKKKWNYGALGFPLTFTLSFIAVFSLSATKLPHYTWPIWPALALQAALLYLTTTESRTASTFVTKLGVTLSRIPLILWAFAFILLALDPISLASKFFESAQFEAIVKYYPGIPFVHQCILVVCGLVCAAVATRNFQKVSLTILAAANCYCCLGLGIATAPIVKALLSDPQTQIGELVRNQFAKPGDCIQYAGPHSPSISLALGHEIFHNRCKPEQKLNYLIVPEWKAQECKERGLETLAQRKYLILCGLKSN